MSIDYFGKEGMSYKTYNFYNRKSIQSIKAQPPKKGTFHLNSVHFVDSNVHHFIMNYYVQESMLFILISKVKYDIQIHSADFI